jgi:hypothetical protein
MIHEGKSLHRLSSNPLEKAYHDAWLEHNDQPYGGTLAYLLGDGNRPSCDFTERDAEVAATIIQWLGSPVGQRFVEGVLSKHE